MFICDDCQRVVFKDGGTYKLKACYKLMAVPDNKPEGGK